MTVLEVTAVHGWNAYSATILLHVLLFVYWLGGDLGTFYSSRFLMKPEHPPAARLVAAKIMHGCDLAPRACLILFLPSGVSLMKAGPLGEEFAVSGWLIALMWALFLVWLFFAVRDHVRGEAGRTSWWARLVPTVDLWVRVALVVALVGIGVYTMLAAEPFGVDTDPAWLGGKLTAYALCIMCGVLIRRELVAFGPAFGALMTTGSTPEVEAGIRRSIRRCEPYVYAIYAFVLLAAAYDEHGGELTRTSVEHAAPIGSFTGWTPARTVIQWVWTKETS